MERAVQQNANHRAQLDYRDLPDIAPLSLISNMALNQDKGTRGKGVRNQLKNIYPLNVLVLTQCNQTIIIWVVGCDILSRLCGQRVGSTGQQHAIERQRRVNIRRVNGIKKRTH